MSTNNKIKLLRLIDKLLAGNASIKEIKRLFNFFQSHQEINMWQNHFQNKEIVEEKIFVNIQKKAGIGSYRKSKVITMFQRNLLKYAAVLLLGGLVGFMYLNHEDQLTTEDTQTVRNTIEIGGNKATLTLQDGSMVALENGKSYKKQNVHSNGKEIIYEASAVDYGNKEIAYNYLTIPRGGQFFIQLSDSTKVWLNSESQLKYPVAFAEGSTREVELLYGEAYFEVSPSTQHNGISFKVQTHLQTIEVLGTQFNIKAYKDEIEIYTTLVEGKVKVGKKKENTMTLKPGQQSIISADKKMSIKEVDLKLETAWRHGLFSFKEKSLKDIMKVLSRWYDVDIVFANTDLESIKFKGVLSRNEELENILMTIKNLEVINAYEIRKHQILLK